MGEFVPSAFFSFSVKIIKFNSSLCRRTNKILRKWNYVKKKDVMKSLKQNTNNIIIIYYIIKASY
jgi:hypothetical protein